MRNFKPLTAAIVSVLATNAAIAASPTELRQLSPQAPLSAFVPVPGPVIKNPTFLEPDTIVHTAGAHYFKRAVTSTKPRTTSSEKFVPLPGARTRVRVAAGRNALVNVAFTAESRCNEPSSNAQDWCEVRILVDGVEANPAASSYPPDTYAFDSTDSGNDTIASWESHAMDRHKCVFNQNGETSRIVPVEVQWKVTNFDGGNPPAFWLDDWSLTVEMARGCRQERVAFED